MNDRNKFSCQCIYIFFILIFKWTDIADFRNIPFLLSESVCVTLYSVYVYTCIFPLTHTKHKLRVAGKLCDPERFPGHSFHVPLAGEGGEIHCLQLNGKSVFIANILYVLFQ